ncbi:MAG: glycosyltransferase family 2 protein [Planctomycetes bacterium]|nr:glycosyltransferase family 2 protein [Planctomycetota bacterium]
MSKPLDAVTVVIPVHNVADRLDRIAGWRLTMEKSSGRGFEIIVVDDGSTDDTSGQLAKKEPRTRILRHDTRKGFGACLRTALPEAKHPLFFYTALDYPYTPSDVRPFFDRIELKDEFLGKTADLISGCRTGLPTPLLPQVTNLVWRYFWRVFAGMPIPNASPWHGWSEFWYRTRVSWIYGVPLTDVNSCFKLFRTAFLRRFPIQSDGDFVHTELVAKATFLTSIMDEVPLTPKPDPVPAIGSISADSRRVFRHPQFAIPTPQTPVVETPVSPTPAPVPLS